MRWIAGALAGLLLPGCMRVSVNRCQNGAICRDDQACTEKTAMPCGVPEEVEACFGTPNRTACTRADGLPGSCVENRCGACDPNWVECRYSTWTAMTVPSNSAINGLSALAPNDIYAVTDTQLLHYDGTAWSVLEGDPTNSFKGVWAADPSNVFFGDFNNGRVFRNDSATVEHAIPGTSPVRVQQVWGTGLDNILVIASGERISSRVDNSWTDFAPSAATAGLTDVWGTKNSAYAVGLSGLILNGQRATWTPVTPSGPPLSGVTLLGIWGASLTDMYLVGHAGTLGVAYRFDGTAVTTMQLPDNTAELTGVWGTAPNDIYAVGDSGTVLHYDGTFWTSQKTPNPYPRLQAVTGIGHDIYVGGVNSSIWKLSAPP